MQSRLQCQLNGHNNNEVNSICMNLTCQQFRPCCIKCLKQNHKDHFEDVIDFNDLPNNKYKFKQFNNLLNILEISRQQIYEMLKEITNLIEQFNQHQILSDGNLQEIHQSAQNFIVNEQQFEATFLNQSPFKNLIQKCEQILTNFQQTTNDVSFSEKLAPYNIQLLNKNTIAQQLENRYPNNQYILSNYQIPMNKVTTYKFKIIKLAVWIGVGICYKSTISTQNKFISKQYGNAFFLEGAFLISSNGHLNSPFIKYDNKLKQTFKFNTNDIIEISVNPEKEIIIFTKFNTGEKYSLLFKISDDLVPCACLGKNGDSVEILQV